MSRRVRRISIVLGLVLVVALLIGVASADRLSDDDSSSTSSVAVPTQPEPEPYPLAPGTTPEQVQILVFERAYSECASTETELLASKYKSANTSSEGVAAAVGRAWASYFDAGQDAVTDGRDGCLQGQADRD